jgi:flagellar protein FlaG
MKISPVPFSDVLVKEIAPTSTDSLTRKKAAPRNDEALLHRLDRSDRTNQKPVQPVVNGLGIGLEFSVDKETGVTVIKVLDIETGEVVRQIPPEEVLAFMRQFEKNGPLFSRWL